MMLVYSVLLQVAKWIGPPKRQVGKEGYDVLLTGTFYSDNWVMAHVRPLAMSENCARVTIVSNYPIPRMTKVEAVYPPAWLVRTIGEVSARLLTFIWVGFKRHPHIAGGFHLSFNGLVAILLGKFIGARSIYFCVGGPAEVIDGGSSSENRLFSKLAIPDPTIERKLIRAVDEFDLVITMGKRAVDFFRKHGVKTNFKVVSGGLDTHRFFPNKTTPATDIIFIGRLSPIKRADLLLKAVKDVQRQNPNISVTIVGDGPLREFLGKMASEIGISENVSFIGHQKNVEEWLRKAKVFVLTSDSEGLSLALMEAMLCGVPAVVSKVGDLEELVEDGINGYLVAERTPEAFAKRLEELLTNEGRLAQFSEAAHRSAKRYEISAAVQLWDEILTQTQWARNHYCPVKKTRVGGYRQPSV
jgi:glycosyltransferase involved in cell wall biosynthesis